MIKGLYYFHPSCVVIGGSEASMITFSTFSGGISTELTGGNFWQGAITGGLVAGLNHAMHKLDPPKGFKGKSWTDKDGTFTKNEDGSYNVDNSPEGIGKYKEIQEVVIRGKSKLMQNIEDITNGLGISASTKETLAKYFIKGEITPAVDKYFRYTKYLGRVTGAYGVASSTIDFMYNPSWKSGTKAIISIAATTKYVSPPVALILGISEVTGFTDWTLNKIYGK
ncbi:hypothetical protein [Riemerella columbina]|uniref:hypothetical protein n=1 Tax=Riemerella columbina TaxID=103810 RepID=UPI0026706947|nr:hypothetical protein [Riemerella columbina]WKS95300.1 hypothetical protein NYR17_00750 [Riemerella columbina]